MKYLKYFETEAAYASYKNGSDFVLPNVSYVVENNSVSYDPVEKAKSGVIMARYNATEENKLAIADTSNVKSLKVNGAEVEFGEMYCFSEVGEYDVEIELIDTTLINGVNFSGDMPKSMFWGILENGPTGACLTSIILPEGIITIGSQAFCECKGLTGELVIPDSVTTIEEQVFQSCLNLTSVVIGSGVTSIGSSAFDNCLGLKSIVVSEGNKIYDSRENCNCIIETATNTLLLGCDNSFIPDSVTSISRFAFYRCSGLTSITIPNSVTSIGYGAFGYCSGLTSITIPNSVTSIESEAFRNCTSLDIVYIESNVTSIGEKVFYDCSCLTSIICNTITAPTISSYTFQNIKSGGVLKVPVGSNYSSWMSTSNYYLGKYNWTIEYI